MCAEHGHGCVDRRTTSSRTERDKVRTQRRDSERGVSHLSALSRPFRLPLSPDHYPFGPSTPSSALPRYFAAREVL